MRSRIGGLAHITSHPACPYLAPFILYILFIGASDYLPFGPDLEYPLCILSVSAFILFFSRSQVSIQTSHLTGSLLVGFAVFAIWIGPDLLSKAYRQHWWFQNTILGFARSSLPQSARTDPVFLIFRIIGTSTVVPIIEELFWRGWLMRYLVSNHFQRVRLGTYGAMSFWLTALLFASEHGPFWDVSLLAGIIYNWWIIRTHNLGNCILAHAITNACLAIYIVVEQKWQYWL